MNNWLQLRLLGGTIHQEGLPRVRQSASHPVKEAVTGENTGKTTDVSLPIENYALIGDCETAALVGNNGSIDWLCWPDFSSPACFAALLGTAQNGRWLLGPREKAKSVTRKYLDHTLILETTFKTASGVLLLTDFMPIRGNHSDVVRMVRCLDGRIPVMMELRVRFDYGRTIPWTGAQGQTEWVAAGGTGVVYLRTHQKLRTRDDVASAEFILTKGEKRSFVLTYAAAQEPPPRRINTERAYKETEEFWRRWCAINQYEGPWKGAIERSLITLKALTYRPSGAIVAAPTTSLPEQVGANLNWDYRFCWLRDGAFTLDSLLSVGYREEAQAWQEWLLQSVGSDVRQLQIMYGIRGERHLPEYEIPWLPGYRGSAPVRVGNAASKQMQFDVYGEVSDALFNMYAAKMKLDPRLHRLRREIVDYVAGIGNKRASGIWEGRGAVKEFTYSKVMAWLTLDHGVRAIESRQLRGSAAIWKQKRDQLHRNICRHGFNRKIGSFVQSFGSNRLDASLLLIPIAGFLPFRDQRIQGTIAAIQKRLIRNGLVLRYLPVSKRTSEGAFLACSFWLVHNLVGIGRKVEAERLYEKLLSLRNDVGLLSEEYDTREGKLVGNFPQALSHIALINAGRVLSASR